MDDVTANEEIQRIDVERKRLDTTERRAVVLDTIKKIGSSALAVLLAAIVTSIEAMSNLQDLSQSRVFATGLAVTIATIILVGGTAYFIKRLSARNLPATGTGKTIAELYDRALRDSVLNPNSSKASYAKRLRS